MCGIVGLLQRDRAVSLEAIEAGRDILAHRGPDGAGLWHSSVPEGGQVVLGHRRLSIIDLSARAAQPLLTTCNGNVRPASMGEEGRSRFALTYNGEIYNYLELRDELRTLGYRFTSDSDTEVLLRAYEQWGWECLERLNGMFAFALWDSERRELFCARDRFGEKPFHYVLDEARGVFAFASEIKALIRAGIVRPTLDERAVYRYLKFGEQAGVTQTIWRGVRRLGAAEALLVALRGGEIRHEVRSFWRLDLRRRSTLSFARQTEEFRELFRNSVMLRLRADVAVGTGLSGGLDSSSVVCQIRELGVAAGQQAFTARMDDAALDESAHAQLVAAVANVNAHAVTPTATSLLEVLDALFWAQEEPFQSTSMFASFLVSRLAREHGCVVLLDGQGADEYLAGYSHYPALILSQLARQARLAEWWRERRAVRARLGVDPVPPRAALHYLVHSVSGERRLNVDADRCPAFLRDDFSKANEHESPRSIPFEGTPLRTRLFADLMLGHLQELLRYADRNSMHFSREVRLPFLDHRLVEFALSLPDESLFHRGESKRILRAAMRGIVPDQILDRRDKIGFATPWKQWWNGETGASLNHLLQEAEKDLAMYVEPGVVTPGSSDSFSIIGLARAKAALEGIARHE